MNSENTASQECGPFRRVLKGLGTKTAKFIGAIALSGAAGYAMAKGVETFIMPVEANEVYEAMGIIGGVIIGGLLAGEIIYYD